MRGALILLLAFGLLAVAAPTATADTAHLYDCAGNAVGCVQACVDHVMAHVAAGQPLANLPLPCLMHP